jgi:hypothetical protein
LLQSKNICDYCAYGLVNMRLGNAEAMVAEKPEKKLAANMGDMDF